MDFLNRLLAYKSSESVGDMWWLFLFIVLLTVVAEVEPSVLKYVKISMKAYFLCGFMKILIVSFLYFCLKLPRNGNRTSKR